MKHVSEVMLRGLGAQSGGFNCCGVVQRYRHLPDVLPLCLQELKAEDCSGNLHLVGSYASPDGALIARLVIATPIRVLP